MNKEWVDTKEKERIANLQYYTNKAIQSVEEADFLVADFFLGDNLKELYLKNIKKDNYYFYLLDEYILKDLYKDFYIEKNESLKTENVLEADFNEWFKNSGLKEFCSQTYRCTYKKYLDSDPKEFDGDIIITDPGYVVKSPADNNIENDWFVSECGYDLEKLGIQSYMTRDTLYGDWSCTTYNSDTGVKLGNFCADGGLVSVILLEELLKYNPEFNDHIKRPWTTTWIKNFKGTVQFIVKKVTGIYEYGSECHKIGDTWSNYQVEVVGHGIDKISNEPINFIGKQTGFLSSSHERN